MKGGRVRVIAGSAGGLWILLPKGFHSRPTQDKVKQAIFSMLGESVVEARTLDLFSGSGALGIEALSRGSGACDFVEAERRYVETLQTNLLHCHLAGKVFAQKAEAFLRTAQPVYQLILLDPPYDDVAGDLAKTSLAPLLHAALAPKGIIVWEASVHSSWSEFPGLPLLKRAVYGDTAVYIFQRDA